MRPIFFKTVAIKIINLYNTHMTTVDSLLTKIINHNFSDVEKVIPSRDSKILKTLATIIHDPVYITENQGRLLVKILKEHQDKFNEFENEISLVTATPTWARNFRVLQHVRKVYLTGAPSSQRITIEATFSADLRHKLSQLNKTVYGFVQEINGKLYSADLTEKNIVEIVDKLKPFNFDVSKELEDYYDIIKSWSEEDVKNQYRITTISHPNFEKQIISDLGINTAIDQNIINDRSVRYQYFVEKPENLPENLPKLLSCRAQTKVWVDKNQYTLDDLIGSIIELKRLPILVVFDSNDSKKCLESLKNLSNSLEEYGIFDDIGIYFRLDNTDVGKEFNQFISNKQYNCQLDSSTKIVGVQSGKIPKFLLKSDWKPMSVISLNTTLRHSKTAVYSNCCDLIATYSDSQPVIEARSPWE